ncbi:PTS IIA-like nitrogen regulatory protein PtsN [Thalassotalea sp. LPB0316]|uniref:PTS IIA-like nitrogen regulatory protein PtsN n=1 Tax=Thalassotalea sp. LPB0316 TaxID=2769490 RepID=UPI001868A899|nr:PTS IIA-like nitrogen regulatory protein PtsN [Thalassotalea sp. LPB0316]QOL26895.1 PTS IIA-like nitrogen regulatory protein PtsN [Thalassotalea sp. LPB0316]
MKLQDILTLDCTICAAPASSKKRLFDTICDAAARKLPETSQHDLLQSLTQREQMGSTGIGNGIAIPHGRLINGKHAVAVLITTEQPIAFDAIDNQPVDIFIALFVPEASCQEHLATLQNIAQLFSDKKVVKNIRKCQDNHQLFEIIQEAS